MKLAVLGLGVSYSLQQVPIVALTTTALLCIGYI
jgi:hypothetical protein